MLEDIAVLTAGTAIFEDVGIKLEKMKLDDLGRAKKWSSIKTTQRSLKEPVSLQPSRVV